jgi:hypothetical protein
VLLIAAVQASHARWFPSLPARNLGLARAQFRNATEGMTQDLLGQHNCVAPLVSVRKHLFIDAFKVAGAVGLAVTLK